jgi:hypothetical protein
MKHILLTTGIALLVTGSAYANTEVKLYSTQSAAKKHCPGDAPVRVNLSSKVYHLPGTRDYGTTKNGKYTCLGKFQRTSSLSLQKMGSELGQAGIARVKTQTDSSESG